MINIKLDVLKIPKDRIFTGQKGKYLDIVVAEMQNTDQYGNTHTVFIGQTKDEREQKAAKIYIGKGKEVTFAAQSASNPQAQYTAPPTVVTDTEVVDDLPF